MDLFSCQCQNTTFAAATLGLQQCSGGLARAGPRVARAAREQKATGASPRRAARRGRAGVAVAVVLEGEMRGIIESLAMPHT